MAKCNQLTPLPFKPGAKEVGRVLGYDLGRGGVLTAAQNGVWEHCPWKFSTFSLETCDV